MNVVMTIFGKMCSVVMLSLVLLAVIFKSITVGENQGFFGIVSALSTMEEGQPLTYTDSKKVREIVSGQAPKISYETEKNVCKQKMVQLENYFWIKSCDSQEKIAVSKWREEGGSFQVEEIKRKDGTKLTEIYDKVSGKIVFPKAGIYELQIAVRDKENRRARVLFSIPVEE